MADADLTTLRQNGFNLVYLYLWDKTSLQELRPTEAAGFCPYPNHPASGSGCNASNQWRALADFVQRAETKGLYVALHFVSGKLIQDLGSGVPASISSEQFRTWAKHFIDMLTPGRKNVLLWGLAYAVVPPEDTTNNWALTWRDAYKKVDEDVKLASPNPWLMGVIGVNLSMSLVPNNPIIPRLGSYQWPWQTAQRVVKAMRTLLTGAYGYGKDPDVYMMQLWHPNSTDMQSAVNSLVTAPYNPSIAVNPPANKIFVVEFATSSSVKEPGVPSQDEVKGNDIQSWGDDNTPTLTPTRQDQWLRHTLCGYIAGGVQKFAYWSLYDPYTMWKSPPWRQSGYELTWNGYWGLKYVRESDGDKPSWSTLRNFYLSGSLSCSAPRQPANTLKADNAYYTIGQPAGVIWTAADIAGWTITDIPSNATSYSCDQTGWEGNSPTGYVYWQPNGSCAYAYSTPATITGTRTFTFTAQPVGGASPTALASASVTILGAPFITTITNSLYSGTISQKDFIVVWGNGFSRFGGNTLQFVRPGYPDVWMWINDGYWFWERSYTQIWAWLGGRLAPGQWTLYVRNGYPSGPSSGFSVYINP